MAYLLQLLVLGTPILVIAYDDITTFYIVASLVLFLSSFGTTLLIYAPKDHALRVRRQTGQTGMASIMIGARNASTGTTRSYHRQATGGSVEEIRLRALQTENKVGSQSSVVQEE